MRRIARAEGELSDLVILSLVATFERTLHDSVASRSGKLLEGSDTVDRAIHAALISDIEYWRIADRLIVIFKDQVEADHLGRIKQIVGYRNWVAHGRATKEPPDGNVTPRVAFEQLTGFLSKAGIIDP